MSRPEKERMVGGPPLYADFKPARVPMRILETIDLSLDEFESIRLSEYLGHDHAAAAREMGVSRPTFTRLHERACRKVSRFIVEGLHLSIGGGQVHFRYNLVRCKACNAVFRSEIGSQAGACPSCGSTQIEDLAAQHGHGQCCTL